MILLDSCAVLDILFGESDAVALSKFLDSERGSGVEVVFLPLTLLESSTVVSVRFKEGRTRNHSLKHYLNILKEFATMEIIGDMDSEIIVQAAQIKSEHAASMVDCYLIANAMKRGAEIVTSDSEILKYLPKKSKLRKITKKFSSVQWPH